MSTAMTKEEREAFLADVHVGVLSVERDGRAPLVVPVWYGYTPGGDVIITTGAETQKARALRAAGRCSLCAQEEAPPYRYVSVEGTLVSMEPTDAERDVRPLARRYLGVEGGDRWMADYLRGGAAQDNVLIRMRPQRWLSADFGKAM